MSPIFIAAGAVFIGTTLRTFFLMLGDKTPDKILQVVGPFVPEDILMQGLIGINLGVACWLIGYSFPVPAPQPARKSEFFELRFKRVVALAIAFSIVLNIYYTYKIDFFSNISQLGWSTKRMFDIGGIEGGKTTFQYLKIGADIASASTLAFACYYYRVAHTFRNFLILTVLFLIAIFVPLIASIRGEIVYLFLSILIVRHYSLKKTSIRTLLVVFVSAMVLLSYLEGLRQKNKVNREASTFAFTKIVHTLVYTAHFVGVGKTSVIMTQIPKKYDYLKGSSYLSVFIAPIPRVLWLNKPVVRIGQFVGVKLMERKSISGVVPGVIGEAYMNFGIPGIMVILLAFGVFCKRIYVRFTTRIKSQENSIFTVGIYAILWIFMLDVFVTDFTGNIIRLLRNLLPFLLIAALSQSAGQVKSRLGSAQ